jgi:hypothetical protein
MDSNTLLQLGFCEWKPFKKGVEKLAPQNKGNYAFRSLVTLALKVGSSDMVYIGRAMGDRKGPYHNIQHCLREYLHPGHSQATKKRIGQKALTEGWEVSWIPNDFPDQLECQLLQCFYHHHEQLPPENKNWPPGCDPALQSS